MKIGFQGSKLAAFGDAISERYAVMSQPPASQPVRTFYRVGDLGRAAFARERRDCPADAAPRNRVAPRPAAATGEGER